MQGAFSEHEYGQAGSDPSSLQQQGSGSEYPSPTGLHAGAPAEQQGFLKFLNDVLENEEKTRRLGYLIRQAGLVITTILIALAAAMYIAMYKSSIEMKAGVGLSSTLVITAGSLFVRIRKSNKPEGGARGSPRTRRTTKPTGEVSPDQECNGRVRQSDGADR
jgi:hypothetical protein